jgi:FkbM family methyltransferase
MKKNSPRQLIGRLLVSLCDTWPAAKPSLEKLGLRTKKEWFRDRIVRVQLPNGDEFKLASFSQNYLSFELFWRGAGYYEPITRLLLQELVQPGHGAFIDLGANIGFYSLIIATSRPNVRVVAFEPNPRNHTLLRLNRQVNQLGNLMCEPLAISDRDGTATLYLSSSDMSASLCRDFEDHDDGEAIVQTTTLDNYLERQPLAGDLTIKVDVEGHEEAFFRGALRTMTKRRPDIIAEVALSYPRDVVAMLAQLGYRFYRITDRGLLPAQDITPTVRGNLVFLNYLISVRPPASLAAVFQRISPEVQRIDLARTSKYHDAVALRAFKDRNDSSTRTDVAVPISSGGASLSFAGSEMPVIAQADGPRGDSGK